MSKWWQTRPSRPDRSHRIHPYKIEATSVGSVVVINDIKEGRNSVLAGLGHFDVDLLTTNEMFERPGDGSVDFPEDVSLLPFWVHSKKHKNIREPSGEFDVSKTPLVLKSQTQVAGNLLFILLHPRLCSLLESKLLTVWASVSASARDLEPESPMEVGLNFEDGVLVFEEGATIGVSYELMLVMAGTVEMKMSSFDFVAVIRELR